MQKNTLYINKGKIIATGVVLLVVFMLFKACSGPNLEVSVETSTTNLQQEAGMGGLFDWGQVGQIDYKKQIIKVVSLEDDDIEIYNVIINKGNCKSSFDERVQSAVNSFYKQFERAEGALFYLRDDEYFKTNKRVIVDSYIYDKLAFEYNDGVEEIKWSIERQLLDIIRRYKGFYSRCQDGDTYEYCVCLNEQKRVIDMYKNNKSNEYEKVDKDFEQCYGQEWQAIENEGKEFLANIFATFAQELNEAKYALDENANFSYTKEKGLEIFKKIFSQIDKGTERQKFLAKIIFNDILYSDETIQIRRMKEWDTQKAINIYDSYGIRIYINYYDFGSEIFKPRDITSEEILQQHIDKSKQVQAQYEDYVKKGVKFKNVSDNAEYQRKGNLQYYFRNSDEHFNNFDKSKNFSSMSIIEIESLPKPPQYAVKLDYGKSANFRIYNQKCKVKEVKIETNKGEATYSF